MCTSYVLYFLHAKEQRQQSEVLRHAGGCDRAAPQPLQWWPSCVVSAEEQVTTTTKAHEHPPHGMRAHPGWLQDGLQDISELTYWEQKSSETLLELLAQGATNLEAPASLQQAMGPTFSCKTTDFKHSLQFLRAGLISVEK